MGDLGRRSFLKATGKAAVALSLVNIFEDDADAEGATKKGTPPKPAPKVKTELPKALGTYGFIVGAPDVKVYGENEDTIVHKASLTKVATVLAFLDYLEENNIPLDEPLIPITAQARDGVRYQRSSILRTDRLYTPREVVRLMMTCSYNDVTRSVAEYVASRPQYREEIEKAGLEFGTERTFADYFMMRTIKKIMKKYGIENPKTVVFNSTGLPPDENKPVVRKNNEHLFNISTPREIGILINELYMRCKNNPRLIDVLAARTPANTNWLIRGKTNPAGWRDVNFRLSKTGTSDFAELLGMIMEVDGQLMGTVTAVPAYRGLRYTESHRVMDETRKVLATRSQQPAAALTMAMPQ